MNIWFLVQALVDLLMLAGVATLWVRLMRPPAQDPRLSRGLQLLQSKISILEDLADRTEEQVDQMKKLIEKKTQELQHEILQSEQQIQKIEASRNQSLEVAKIFQDKIPHQEIIERQNTMKYIRAAQLAHQGKSVEEISKEVDLNLGEIEFIAKVNRDRLQFAPEDLPDWAKTGVTTVAAVQPTLPEVEKTKLSSLGDKFRQAIPVTFPRIEKNG